MIKPGAIAEYVRSRDGNMLNIPHEESLGLGRCCPGKIDMTDCTGIEKVQQVSLKWCRSILSQCTHDTQYATGCRSRHCKELYMQTEAMSELDH